MATSLDQTLGASTTLTSLVSSMMDSPYQHYSQDLQPINFNGTSSQELANNLPAQYYNTHYLQVHNTNHNYQNPYNQNANCASISSTYNQAVADYYSANEYQTSSYPAQIGNHDNNQSSSLNTPTLDQAVSSYYPAFHQQPVTSTLSFQPTSDYYLPAQQQQHSTGLAAVADTGSHHNQPAGLSHEPLIGTGSVFASPSQYSSPAQHSNNYSQLSGQGQHHPALAVVGHNGGSKQATYREFALDRLQARATPHPAPSAHTQSMQAIEPSWADQTVSSQQQQPKQTEAHNYQQNPLQQQQQSQEPHRTETPLPLQLKLGRPTASGSDSTDSANSPATRHTSYNNLAPFLSPNDLKAPKPRAPELLARRLIVNGKNHSLRNGNGAHKGASSAARGLLAPGGGNAAGVGGGGQMISRRKNATRETTATLKDWLDEHDQNPYPTKGEKIMLSIITKMSLTQVSTWFANARRRMKKENKLFWGNTGKQGSQHQQQQQSVSAAGGGQSNNGRGGSSQANRGTASIRYFISKHQKQLAGASSMLALAGHRIQSRPFVFCNHLQSGSYSKQSGAETKAEPPKGPPSRLPIKAIASSSASSAAAAVASSTPSAAAGGDSSSSSGLNSRCSSRSGLGSPVTTTTEQQQQREGSAGCSSSKPYDDTF